MRAPQLVSGGKVWEFNKYTPVSDWYRLHLVSIPLALWTIAAIVMFNLSRTVMAYEVIQQKTYGSEYGARVVAKFDSPTGFLILGIMSVVALTTMFIIHKVAMGKKVIWTCLGTVAIGAIAAFIACGIGSNMPLSFKPDPFSEWAKNTYGYTSMMEVNDGSTQTVYQAVNAQGETVRVKMYQDDEYKYLYENKEQLKNVLAQVVEKKLAWEDEEK